MGTIEEMRSMMNNPEEMQKWMDEKGQEFDAPSDDN